MSVNSIKIIRADFENPQHREGVVEIMDAYSRDPMGDAQPLSDFARANLAEGLRRMPTAIVFLVMDAEHERPRGVATCFRGFSTFAAKPLINISDFYVDPELRGKGLGLALLKRIEEEALASGCCKLSLEVQSNNSRARAIYESFGFTQAVYPADEDGNGGSLYMTKELDQQ